MSLSFFLQTRLNVTSSTFYLTVKWVIVEEISAVKLLAVSLIHCDHILFSFEDLNLVSMYYIYAFYPMWPPHQQSPGRS